VANSYATDAHAQDLLSQLALHSPNAQGFSLHQGIIKQGAQIWLGENSTIGTKLIFAFHSTALGGHSGIHPTYLRIKKLFSWRGLKQDVENFVNQCQPCQQAKSERTNPAGLLQPLPIPTGAWQDNTMDFIGLPKSVGFNSILVIVDRFSKYAHVLPLKHPFSAKQVAQVVLDMVVRLHGMPQSIVSDRDRIFTSNFWKELFKLYYTTLVTSTAYHPQTDGQSERVNQSLEMFLRCCIQDSPKKWKSWLPLAEFWYNTSHHSSMGCTPFKALYGYDPNVAAAPLLPVTANTSVQELIAERSRHTELIKQHLSVAQNRMKLKADKHRIDRIFQVGDHVLLKLQPYTQSSLVNRPYPKLSYKFFGPYRVVERVGTSAYKLDLPERSQIHPVFHVSQLKPFTPDYTPVYSDLPVLVDFSQEQLLPEVILERQLVKKGNAATPQE
jgi:transposase InsO family protein